MAAREQLQREIKELDDFTTNLRRAELPTCFLVHAGEGGLTDDSVALCHQLRALDNTRLDLRSSAVSLPGPTSDLLHLKSRFLQDGSKRP